MTEEYEEEEEHDEEPQPEIAGYPFPNIQLLSLGEKAQAKIDGVVVDQIDPSSKRYIFPWKEFVIKIDPHREGESGDKYDYQAYAEWRVYRQVRAEDKMYFAEVVGYGVTLCGRRLSIQRFIPDMQSIFDWSDNDEVRKAMGDHAQMIGDKYGIYDIHWNNFGVVNDEPMLYDLGATYYLRDHEKIGDQKDCMCEECVARREGKEMCNCPRHKRIREKAQKLLIKQIQANAEENTKEAAILRQNQFVITASQ